METVPFKNWMVPSIRVSSNSGAKKVKVSLPMLMASNTKETFPGTFLKVWAKSGGPMEPTIGASIMRGSSMVMDVWKWQMAIRLKVNSVKGWSMGMLGSP